MLVSGVQKDAHPGASCKQTENLNCQRCQSRSNTKILLQEICNEAANPPPFKGETKLQAGTCGPSPSYLAGLLRGARRGSLLISKLAEPSVRPAASWQWVAVAIQRQGWKQSTALQKKAVGREALLATVRFAWNKKKHLQLMKGELLIQAAE